MPRLIHAALVCLVLLPLVSSGLVYSQNAGNMLTFDGADDFSQIPHGRIMSHPNNFTVEEDGRGYTILINLSPGLFYPPVPFVFDAGGVKKFAMNLRIPVLAGITFYAQALESRGSTVYLSNGLRILFGP